MGMTHYDHEYRQQGVQVMENYKPTRGDRLRTITGGFLFVMLLISCWSLCSILTIPYAQEMLKPLTFIINTGLWILVVILFSLIIIASIAYTLTLKIDR